MKVPVNEPVVSAETKKYVMDALDTGWLSSAGPYIGKFEQEFADYVGVKHGVTTTNGTTALHLALASLGIGPGDEVIVPAFTMIAPIFAIIYTGARPVLIDCEIETFNMDVTKLESLITPRTKAILPVHLYGHPVDMDPVLALAEKHDLWVIEDAAEVHGATYKGKRCGSMGDVSCFSFYGNKIVTSGEGGMLLTNDDTIAARARQLKDLAHSPAKRFWHEEIGWNYRMTNLQAACGLGSLHMIDEALAKKKWMAAEYGRLLGDVAGLRLPITKDWAENVYWMYCVLVEPSFGMSRDTLREKLKEKGIDTRDFFYSAAPQPAVYEHAGKQGPFPVTDDIAERGFYLPSGLALTQEQIEYVCATLKDIAHATH